MRWAAQGTAGRRALVCLVALALTVVGLGPAAADPAPPMGSYTLPDDDPLANVPYEQILADEANWPVAAVVGEAIPDSGLPDFGVEKPPEPPLVSGDISMDDFIPGEITITVKPRVRVLDVVTAHGGTAADVIAPVEPYDDADVAAGVDRSVGVRVPPGQEKTKVKEYATDTRVEYAGLEPGDDIIEFGT